MDYSFQCVWQYSILCSSRLNRRIFAEHRGERPFHRFSSPLMSRSRNWDKLRRQSKSRRYDPIASFVPRNARRRKRKHSFRPARSADRRYRDQYKPFQLLFISQQRNGIDSRKSGQSPDEKSQFIAAADVSLNRHTQARFTAKSLSLDTASAQGQEMTAYSTVP